MIRDVKGLNDDLHAAGDPRHLHDLPQHARGRQSLGADAARHRPGRREPSHARPCRSTRCATRAPARSCRRTDPGRALITGKWNDIGKFKGPTLRALAPRAPYFHNGSAKDLNEVVDFYNTRFGIGFTDQEREDLVAFLKAL